MNEEELELYTENTLKFNNLDDAFEDYIYDYTLEDLKALLTDEMKEQIIKLSPSYVKKDEKYYFNGEFQELTDKEIEKIINKKESEVK